MAWFLAAIAAAISLWVVSLSRILSSSHCVPSYPPFLHAGSGKKRNVLLVISHPDDESMFFAPTILFLNSEGHCIHILCMSTGNTDGIGNIRKEEIYRACAVLKVPPQQVKVIDHPNFQDGFKTTWDPELLARVIEDETQVWDIDSIITFDDFGVSDHPNHRAVHFGVCTFLSNNKQKYTEAWELVSQSIFRKYSGPVDVWLSIMASSFCSQRQVPEVVCSLLRLYLHEYTSANQVGVENLSGLVLCICSSSYGAVFLSLLTMLRSRIGEARKRT